MAPQFVLSDLLYDKHTGLCDEVRTLFGLWLCLLLQVLRLEMSGRKACASFTYPTTSYLPETTILSAWRRYSPWIDPLTILN